MNKKEVVFLGMAPLPLLLCLHKVMPNAKLVAFGNK